MRIWCPKEYYLLYFGIFPLLEAASIDFMKSKATSSVDILTTTERSLEDNGSTSDGVRTNKLKRTLQECNDSFNWICLKLEFIKILENLTEHKELHLMKGISIVKDPQAKEFKSSEILAEVARSYPNNPNARLNGYIISKIHNFLQTYYLRFKLIDDKTIEEARSLIETERKGHFAKKAGLEMLFAAGIMMKGTIIALAIAFIGLVAGKALITALMALTISTVVGLKSLAISAGKTHTYEIVAKPIYTSSHSHLVGHDDGVGGVIGHSGSAYGGYGGYARTLNFNLPQNLRRPIKVE